MNGPEPGVRRFQVYEGSLLVLSIADEPGTLRSTAAPQDATPVASRHAFVDAQSHDAVSEHELREVLMAASSFDDFVRRLLAAGYDLNSTEQPELGPGHRIMSGNDLVGAAWKDQGPFVCLWWSPGTQDLVSATALVVAYDVAHAERLRGLAAAASDYDDLMVRLEAAGYGLAPLGR